MKSKVYILIFILTVTGFYSNAFAQMKKAGQSGMTYLGISLSARESAMGNASVASVEGAQSIFYNQAYMTEITGFSLVVNQVSWLADTRIYGIGAVYGMGQYGSFGIDLVYMDYGKIVGTVAVPKSENPRGFRITGDLDIQDYSIGFAYAYPVSDRFSFGVKVKYVYENLGSVAIATGYKFDDNGDIIEGEYEREDRVWDMSHWGFDFGAAYKIGFEDLAFAVAFQNYSTDMKYWSEVFQLPLVLRMGLSMDLARVLLPEDSDFEILTSIDALHPIDYTERVHVGSEIAYRKMFYLRGGYKFNSDVENFSLGMGFKFDYAGYGASLDYSYTNAEFFGQVNRFSLSFAL